MKTFTTADLNKRVGSVTDAALREPIVITHHRKPRFVLMSVESYAKLAQPLPDPRRNFTLETMPEDLRDGLLALAEGFEEEAGRAD
jgi:prevent-host-death family protein